MAQRQKDVGMNPKPISVLLCALGGEGGGVLTDWLVEAARVADFPCQATSIPGVAQRTGATTYYLEIMPQTCQQLQGRLPVLGLSPVAGQLDLLVSSELLETVRQITQGMCAQERTRIISSNSRILTTTEKMKPDDGRIDSQALMKIVQSFSLSHHLIDMAGLCQKAGTMVSAVMLGCIAASGVLPMSKHHYQQVIKNASSLKGFELAWQVMTGQSIHIQSVESLLQPTPHLHARELPQAWKQDFPMDLHDTLSLACARLIDYQDEKYAQLYADRLKRLTDLKNPDVKLASVVKACQHEVASSMATWMAFDDIIRVSDLKSRPERHQRLRIEVAAKPNDLVRIYDHFKPGLAEIADLMPASLASLLRRHEEKRLLNRRPALSWPIKVPSHTWAGHLMLRMLANLKFIRRLGSRYQAEQIAIESWLQAVIKAFQIHPQAGLEMARCAQLVKGYSATHQRGHRNLNRLLQQFDQPIDRNPAEWALAIASARQAALADESHAEQPQPIRWIGKKPKGLNQSV